MGFFILISACVVRQFYMPKDKGKEILQQMQEDVKAKKHLKKDAKQAAIHAINHTKELADLGDEDAFVQQVKTTFPKISKTELLEKIGLFRELKRIRSGF